jgi:hypothetical protein
MLNIGQIALRTSDINKTVRRYVSSGVHEWIRDTVDAMHIYLHPSIKELMGSSFRVHLAFNYDVMAPLEFELLELIVGQSYQLNTPGQLSHFGYHCNDQIKNDTLDTLVKELQDLQEEGFTVMQVSETVFHTGTRRRYRYAYVNDRLGCPIKIIQRLVGHASKTPVVNESIAQGKELFTCLSAS